MATVLEMIGMMRVSVVPPTLRMNAATLRHDAGLVQSGTDDHDRDDRHHRIGGEAVEQVLVVHQTLRQPHRGGEQRRQAQQHHDGGGRHVDADDLEREQVDGQQQEAGDPGDLDRRHHRGQVEGQHGKQGAGDQLFPH